MFYKVEKLMYVCLQTAEKVQGDFQMQLFDTFKEVSKKAEPNCLLRCLVGE